MNRRQFVGALGAATGAGLILPQVARLDSPTPPFTYTRGTDIDRALATMSAGLAATLDASLTLQEPGRDCDGSTLTRHWWETPFYLTDRQLAEGPTNAMQYQEAVKALRNQAHRLGVTRFYSTMSEAKWGQVEARYGLAIAKAQVERQHLRYRWSLSFLGA